MTHSLEEWARSAERSQERSNRLRASARRKRRLALVQWLVIVTTLGLILAALATNLRM